MTKSRNFKLCGVAFRRGLSNIRCGPLVVGLVATTGLLFNLEWTTNQGTLLTGLHGKLIESLTPTEHRKSLIFSKKLNELPFYKSIDPPLYMAGGSALGVFFRDRTHVENRILRLEGVPNFRIERLIQSSFSTSILSLIVNSLPAKPSAILLGVSPYSFGRPAFYFIFNANRVILGSSPTLLKSNISSVPYFFHLMDTWPRSLVFLGRLYTHWTMERLPFKRMEAEAEHNTEWDFIRYTVPLFDKFFEEDKDLFRKVLSLLHKKGIKIILLETPIRRDFLRVRPDQVKKYETFAEELKHIPEVSYLDHLKNVPLSDADFSDGFHLTNEASTRLAPPVLQAIRVALNEYLQTELVRSVKVRNPSLITEIGKMPLVLPGEAPSPLFSSLKPRKR